jgi:low affinity Fe/Cu permease
MSRSKHAGEAKHPHILSTWFSTFAQHTAAWSGHPFSFLLATFVIVLWVATGPVFHYSDTWQLVINTGTTIVTFLMVFLIQNTQNRDMLSVQLKLSELVLAMKGAENSFAALEDLSDEELQSLHEDCRARAEMTAQHITTRRDKKSTNGKSGDTNNGNGHPAARRATKSRRRSAHASDKS